MRTTIITLVSALVLAINFSAIAQAKSAAVVSGSLWGGYNSNIYNSSFVPTEAFYLSPSVAAGFAEGGFYLQGDLSPQIHLDTGSPGGFNTLAQTGYRFSLFDNFWDWELEYGFSLSQGLGNFPTVANSQAHRFSLNQSFLFEYFAPELSLEYRKADYSELGHADNVLSLGSGLSIFLSDAFSFSAGGRWEEVNSSLLIYQYQGPVFSLGMVLQPTPSVQLSSGMQVGHFVYSESVRIDESKIIQLKLSTRVEKTTEIGIKVIRTLNFSSFADYSYTNTNVSCGVSWGF